MEMVLKFSNWDLEKREGLYKALTQTGEEQLVSVNGVEQSFRIVCAERKPLGYFSFDHPHYGYEHTIILASVEKTKSKQEVEAESAVEKAKSSLEAAKAVLESLKGIVN